MRPFEFDSGCQRNAGDAIKVSTGISKKSLNLCGVQIHCQDAIQFCPLPTNHIRDHLGRDRVVRRFGADGP